MAKFGEGLLAAGLSAALFVASGCGGDNREAELKASRKIAHEAGFANAGERGKDTKDLYVQFGACLLPATVDTKDGTLAIDVPTNIEHNLGAEEFGLDDRLYYEFQDITHARLAHLTDQGITGLEVCTKTALQIDAVFDK